MDLRRQWRVVLGALATAAVSVGVIAAASGVRADGPEGSGADIGFVRDMIDHHDQANLLSAVALRGDTSAPVRNLALDVIAAQRYEIGVMDGWLIEWGLERGAPNRQAMAWMGMPVAPAAMPGMASVAAVDALGRLAGGDLDRRYLELLLEHHRGGVHMADAAKESAQNPNVRWLAGLMARAQRREIREIETLLAH